MIFGSFQEAFEPRDRFYHGNDLECFAARVRSRLLRASRV